MSETSRENFVRLAEKRVARAINDIRLIGNLSDRSNYEFSDTQVAEILATLRNEVRACSKRFKASRKPRRAKVQLVGRQLP
ncbi:MAG: hypothetical protein EOS32_27135 [Mesorhizobium sp.]|nr:MAG: hypothetical protein EOS32_27135 [Mesorhizobium sp.]